MESGARASRSLTWKLILGFSFAVVLQVVQMVTVGHFTAQMQAAAVRVSAAVSASLEVHNALDAAHELRARLAADKVSGIDRADAAVYDVYEHAVEEHLAALHASYAHEPRCFAAVDEPLAAVQRELGALQALLARPDAGTESVHDAADALDDAMLGLEEGLSRTQIEQREAAQEGVRWEREVQDLPTRASMFLAIAGVVLMALFVAWFSRQLVIPIRRVWSELESRVASRTAELAATVAQLENQIAERRRAEQQREEMHQQLVESSRRAGMAEIANGVLHNVGNVLNSVNVSANLLLDGLRKSRLDGLRRVTQLLQVHAHDLRDFFAPAQQGTHVPEYLDQLLQHLEDAQRLLCEEAQDLAGRIGMMKEIVNRHQGHARLSSATVQTRLSDVVDDALAMKSAKFAQYGIRVETCIDWDPCFEIDRSRVLQIVLNLLRNSRQAVRDTGRGGVVRIGTCRAADDRIRLSVTDDGVGIDPADLARIFGHGFTTKRDGHGVGLHHSANAATEMGGRLWAESAGRGTGATFVLELPVRNVAKTPEPAGTPALGGGA